MKLVTWNVNGLRACIDKGFLNYFNSIDADMFCLQETKLSKGVMPLHLSNHAMYFSYADKAGYSGTSIISKYTPIQVYEGMVEDVHNHEGRLITAEFTDFFLVTVYTPNSQNELRRLDYRLQWEEAFLKHIKMLDEIKPVIVCGDLNVARSRIDLARPDSNLYSPGFSKQERDCIARLLDEGFTDTFRLLYPDVVNAYSYWSYMRNARENNIGWRLDYFLVSDRIKHLVKDVKMRKDILGSDHCPIELEIDINLINN